MSTPTPTPGRLEGKVAIITGGASGIGEAATRLFINHGAAVVVADIQDQLAALLLSSINSPKLTYHHCDVRDENQVADTVAYALRTYGKLDIMFSNAGIIGPATSILDLDIPGLDAIMATNLRGAAAAIKHAARAMVEAKIKGSIICTASVAACLGGTGPHSYTASKHALVGLVKSACSELGAHGIRVNCISPFGVATPLACVVSGLTPTEVEEHSTAAANLKGLVLTTHHVAQAALYLASDDSAYVSGLNMTVDGGYSVVSHLYQTY